MLFQLTSATHWHPMLTSLPGLGLLLLSRLGYSFLDCPGQG